VRDADRIVGLLEAEHKNPGKLILNRLKPEMVKKGDMLSAADVVDILALEIIGIVPEDDHVIPASNSGVPVTLNENSRAGVAFRNIARRLTGEKVPIMDLETNTGFFQRLAKFFGGR
jgi:septum site-determining protein MinD